MPSGNLRIALIAPPWTPVPPPYYGGIEQMVHLLAVGLQGAGHEVLLFTTGDSRTEVPRRWVLPEAEGRKIGQSVPEVRHVLHAYRVVRGFDVVHDHTLVGPLYARQFPELRVVTTIHNYLDEPLRDIYAEMARTTTIVGISQDQARGAPELPIARVIHHGVDPTGFPYRCWSGDYCLFLGRLDRDKGAHRAIEAARQAGARLLLAGKMRSEQEVEYFETEVKPRLDDMVQYVGEVDHAHKLELLAGARCLLFPIQWREPFGLVVVEALACGTPVVAFPRGAVPELVENGRTGFLCEDEEGMARAIDFVDDLDRAACRAAVEQRFSAERMVADHLELFECLMRDEPGAAAVS